MNNLSHLMRKMAMILGPLFVCILCGALPALAADSVDSGDTAWVLASSALVMVMTPGLALFYAGMVRKKNALSTIMQSFILIGVIGMTWIVFGFSLAFGTDHGGLIGSLNYLGCSGANMNELWPGTRISVGTFMIFQAMFAIITPALITGAFAERMRFKAFLIFMVVWATVVYVPIAHWVWHPEGWLFKLGALDFAGGTVVHISAGISALCAAIVLGRRKGHGRTEFKPHNLTMTLLGTGLLWFGWFGFNAGSALGANTLAVNAFVVTNTSAAAAAVCWLMIEWWHRGKPTALGAASGAVAGLVAITPASGYVTPIAAIVIGIVVSALCYGAVLLKGRFGYDDSLDVFGVHGVGGIWGALATGLFATKAVNSAITENGLFYGNAALLGKQAIAVATVAVLSFVATFVILKVIALFTPLRVTDDDEETGLDLSQHGEVGYNL